MSHIQLMDAHSPTPALAPSSSELPIISNDSLQLLQHLCQHSQDALCITTTHAGEVSQGKILYINPAFSRMFGYEASEVLGQAPTMLYREDTYNHGQAMETLLQALLHGYSTRVEMMLFDKFGQRLYAETELYPLPYPLLHPETQQITTGWKWRIRNITTHKEIEARLQHIVVETDRQNLALKRTVEREALLRRLHNLIEQKPSLATFCQEAAQLIGEALRVDRSLIRLRHDGNAGLFPVVGLAHPHPLHGKAYEDFLVEDAMLWRTLASEHSGTLVIEDTAQNAFLMPYLRGPQSRYAEIVPRSMVLTGAFYRGHMNGVLCIHSCDVVRHWQPHEVAMLEAAAGQVAIAIEHLRMVEQLVASNEAATRHAEELAATLEKEQQLLVMQSEFVAMASHELRTPLAIVDSSVQLLERQIQGAVGSGVTLPREYVAKHLSKMRRSVIRMLSMVESTLSVAKFEHKKLVYHPEYFDLRQLLSDICQRQHEYFGQRDIQAKLDDVPPRFFGDSKLLDLVFTNLVANACKYSAAHCPVEVGATCDAQQLTLRVRDHGIGVPEPERERLFSKFFRASNTDGIQGTGIGLYIASRLLSLHHGHIRYESPDTGGSCFVISLPLASPHMPGNASSEPQPSGAAAHE